MAVAISFGSLWGWHLANEWVVKRDLDSRISEASQRLNQAMNDPNSSARHKRALKATYEALSELRMRLIADGAKLVMARMRELDGAADP